MINKSQQKLGPYVNQELVESKWELWRSELAKITQI